MAFCVCALSRNSVRIWEQLRMFMSSNSNIKPLYSLLMFCGYYLFMWPNHIFISLIISLCALLLFDLFSSTVLYCFSYDILYFRNRLSPVCICTVPWIQLSKFQPKFCHRLVDCSWQRWFWYIFRKFTVNRVTTSASVFLWIRKFALPFSFHKKNNNKKQLTDAEIIIIPALTCYLTSISKLYTSNVYFFSDKNEWYIQIIYILG